LGVETVMGRGRTLSGIKGRIIGGQKRRRDIVDQRPFKREQI